jgi:hypothetical protein
MTGRPNPTLSANRSFVFNYLATHVGFQGATKHATRSSRSVTNSVCSTAVKRSTLTGSDRLLWAWLCGIWADWRSALVIVQPDTVITWHRKGFRLFWTWKVRRGRSGRPAVPHDVRPLIRRMSRDNPLWGAPRIHGELLTLGIDVGETSVGKYMGRHRRPPSQT